MAASHLIKLRLNPPPNETTTYCYKPAEVAAMLEHSLSDTKLMWLHDVILLLSGTGLRIGELVGLRWSNIDLESPSPRVILRDESRSGNRCQQASGQRTKGHRGRTIPLNSAIVGRLGSLARRSDGRVLSGSHGGVLHPDKIRRALRRDVLEPLAERFPKLPHELKGFADGRLHSFRHYFCSVLASSGKLSEFEVKKLLGHSDSEMTRRYFHLNDTLVAQKMSEIKFVAK